MPGFPRYVFCDECGRRFDMQSRHDVDEWVYGHDCEVPEPELPAYRITGVRPFGMFDTIIMFEAVSEATGERAIIASDHRPARDIREAFAHGDEVIVHPESWQIRRA